MQPHLTQGWLRFRLYLAYLPVSLLSAAVPLLRNELFVTLQTLQAPKTRDNNKHGCVKAVSLSRVNTALTAPRLGTKHPARPAYRGTVCRDPLISWEHPAVSRSSSFPIHRAMRHEPRATPFLASAGTSSDLQRGVPFSKTNPEA